MPGIQSEILPKGWVRVFLTRISDFLQPFPELGIYEGLTTVVGRPDPRYLLRIPRAECV